ncbi:MAG: IclR family transcriptional regulator [Propionibacteriaceae bacterium]
MTEAPKPIEALARGLRILEVLSRTTGALGNGQLARATGLPPSTVSRLTDSLVQLGYLLVEAESGAYRLTPKNLRLGYPILANLPLGGRADRALHELHAATKMTAAIAIRDDLHMAFVSVARFRRPGAVPLAVGGRLPLALSAVGIAYLNDMPEPERGRLITRARRDLERRCPPVSVFDQLLARPADEAVVSLGNWNDAFGGIARTFLAAGELYVMTLVARTEELQVPGTTESATEALDQAIVAVTD